MLLFFSHLNKKHDWTSLTVPSKYIVNSTCQHLDLYHLYCESLFLLSSWVTLSGLKLFKNIYLLVFIFERECRREIQERNRERERATCCFNSKTSSTSRTRPDRSQEAVFLFWCPMWVPGLSMWDPICYLLGCSSEKLALQQRGWDLTGNLMGCIHSKSWLNVLCHQTHTIAECTCYSSN